MEKEGEWKVERRSSENKDNDCVAFDECGCDGQYARFHKFLICNWV
jgi:hypothetical protein